MLIATRNPAMTRRRDATQTLLAPSGEGMTAPREAMIGTLSAGLVAALAAGDLEAARIANEAIGRLLGPAPPAAAEAGAVLELAAARRTER